MLLVKEFIKKIVMVIEKVKEKLQDKINWRFHLEYVNILEKNSSGGLN